MLEILIEKGDANKKIDLLGDLSFEINYLVKDIQDLANSAGTYTKTIQIPDTPNNRFIFGFITDLSIDLDWNWWNDVPNNFNPNKKYKCYVLEQSLTILEGYLQVNRFITSEVNANKIIECTIYGNNTSFYLAMGDSLIEEIDFSEFNFTLDKEFIKGSWTSSNDLGVYFPLIDYGNGWTLQDLQTPSLYKLDVKDFYPAMYIKTLWDKIFHWNGFSYNSDFIENDKRFNNLIIPYYNQKFQNNAFFNQDKIFNVGLSFSLASNYAPATFSSSTFSSTYAAGRYLMGKFYSGADSPFYPRVIINGEDSATFSFVNPSFEQSDRRMWYNGLLLNPFSQSFFRNNYANDTTTDWYYDSSVVPLTAYVKDDFPFFNNYVNDGLVYDNNCYQNRSGEIYKQRFSLVTDIVTNWSNQDIKDRGILSATISGPAQGYNYVLKVEFFREIDPQTGTTSVFWATGKGAQIPADLGPDPDSGAYSICYNMETSSDQIDRKTHWLCDRLGNSNCFTMFGKQIKPTGSDRYLGEFNVNFRGEFLQVYGSSASSPAGATPSLFYPDISGAVPAWYYNDGFNQTTPRVGWWNSGYTGYVMPGAISRSGPYGVIYQATNQPAYGDWYQRVQCQTIFLDGDETNPYYGIGGSISPNGNLPIQPNEKVRAIITLGGKYPGQISTSVRTSYKPPTSATILSSIDFVGEINGGFTSSWYYKISDNPYVNSLTQLFNDVSLDYITGQKVNYNDLVPKNVKQRDFIYDIIKLHNLYIEPDRQDVNFPNRLIVMPCDDYYNLSNDILDWSAKLDLNSDINVQILAETQNKRFVFTYKSDSDLYNKQYTQLSNEIYGQFIYSLQNQFLINETKIESSFSPTPIVQLYKFTSVEGDTLGTPGGIVIPVLLPESGSSNSSSQKTVIRSNWRLLYRNYIETQNTDEIIIFGNKSRFYPYAGPYDNPYEPSYSLNFGQTLGEFYQNPTDQFSNTLFNSYWKQQMEDISDINSKIIVCKMFLQPTDITDFYFYKKVFVRINGVDGIYKVNSIEGYVPGQNSLCTVTLLKTKQIQTAINYIGSTSITNRGAIISPYGTGGGILYSGGTIGD